MASFSNAGRVSGLSLIVGASMLASAAWAQDVIYVPTAPPAPRVEVVPAVPPDRVVTWQPGYWRWNGSEYTWTSGRYVQAPRQGATWIPGRWERRERGWVYVSGHWN